MHYWLIALTGLVGMLVFIDILALGRFIGWW